MKKRLISITRNSPFQLRCAIAYEGLKVQDFSFSSRTFNGKTTYTAFYKGE